MKKALWLFSFIALLVACNPSLPSPKSDETKQSESLNITEISNSLHEEDAIKTFHIAETKKDILVGVQLKQWYRFKRNSLEKKWEKKLQDDIDGKNIKVSSDFKVLYELKKQENLSNKEMKKLLDLLKEET